jgi:rhomboid protease GluP
VVHDELLLVRAGALFRPAVMAGEWWRVCNAMFLHGGFVHLFVNMYGLYLLGRFTEEVFGPARFLSVYLISGLIGGLASTAVGAGALSVGASGAIMGLLGALIVTLIMRRGHWPEAWRRALLGNLVLLGALQIYIGFQVAMIDNAAHVGGMLGGAAATVVLAPGGLVGDGRVGRTGLRILAALLVALMVVAGAFAVRTPIERTLERVPGREVVVGGVRLMVPEYWEIDGPNGVVGDPYLDIQLKAGVGVEFVGLVPVDRTVLLETPQARDPRYRVLLERIAASARPVPNRL